MSQPEEMSPLVGPDRRPRRRARIHRVRNALVMGLIVAGGVLAISQGQTATETSIEDIARIAAGEDLVPAAGIITEGIVPEVLGETITGSFDDSVFVDPEMVGVAPPTVFEGLLTFRGSPTRSFYGEGPIPANPDVHWRYPQSGGLCASSAVGGQPRIWCGTGWTGQPSMFRLDGRLWAVFGALDGAVHFIDAETGDPLLPPFQTNDIIKGSVTIDPDGFPIVYVGSRDGGFRAIAFDGGQPRELWRLDADNGEPTKWNDDWDGAGLILDGYLLVGGENSRLHIVELNRDRGADDGLVTVAPELIFDVAGWDDQLLAEIGDENVSIENSVTVTGDTLYFANSGGLVQGWDLAPLRSGGEPTRVFRYWVGDDVDATIVADADGMLYVAAEYERGTARADALGQLLKLDPSQADDDALVWAVEEHQDVGTGIWGTPALHDNAVIFGSEGGRLRAVDQETGADLWSIDLGFHLWQSPVVVDDVLLMGDCSGTMHAFDVADVRREPQTLWRLRLDDGCIESTPAVWDGMIVVGTRLGAVYGIGESG